MTRSVLTATLTGYYDSEDMIQIGMEITASNPLQKNDRLFVHAINAVLHDITSTASSRKTRPGPECFLGECFSFVTSRGGSRIEL